MCWEIEHYMPPDEIQRWGTWFQLKTETKPEENEMEKLKIKTRNRMSKKGKS